MRIVPNKKETIALAAIMYFVVPSVWLAKNGPFYDVFYRGLEELPSLTLWAISNYQYSFAFLAFVAPAYLVSRLGDDEEKLRKTIYHVLAIGAVGFAIWFCFIYIGLTTFHNVMQAVVG